ncbi:hypothetical protein [Kribbella sp. NPDC004536]|uniref:hypothetical protein n=1 Tax=Kribbella sp. NPDC004536 TaxID=3364106 RepID=UPI00367646BA
MKTYEVTVRREGRWWMVAVPEIDGLTQARRLDEVERMAREYIAVSTDVPVSKVAVDVSGIEAGGQDLLEAKTLVDGLRRRAKDLESLVAELTREVASALTEVDVPVRDVSSVLGVSHQRVSQLVQSVAEGASRSATKAARREFAYDLVVKLDDGRSLRVIEVTEGRSSRSKRPTAGQSTSQNAEASARRTPASRRRQTVAGHGSTRRQSV